MRDLPHVRLRSATALVALAAAVLVVSVGGDHGGFFPQTWRWTAVALFSAAGAALLLRAEVRLTRRDGLALGALLVLAGWMLLSRAWTSVPSLAGLEAERALVYVAALLAFLLLFETSSTEAVLVGLLAAVTVLSAWGLGDYASSSRDEPLVGPLGYANGAGILAAIGVVVAVGLAARTDARRLRLALLAPIVVLLPALVLSESAGAVLSLAAGLAVLAWPYLRVLHSRRGAVPAAVGVLVAAALVAVLSRHNIRWTYWRLALDDYRGHPFLGSGAGSFGRYWAMHAHARRGALDAHSLYVEALAELGPVGLALVAVFLAAVLAAAWKRTGGTAPVVGAFLAYAVHTGIDWDWELPAVTLVGVALAGLLLVRARDESRPAPLSQRSQLALAVAAVALAVVALVRLKTGANA